MTGAGISAESGIPTFRGANGLWSTTRKTETGAGGPFALWKNFRAEELATPQAFARDPKTCWEWYDWRRERIARAVPNPAHFALAACERLTLITQNVDGLHELAGSKDVRKIHGDIWVRRCTVCAHEQRDRVVPLPELPPRCSRCGGVQRPGVVWFGESLPEDVWEASVRAAADCDLLLVVGTSAQVFPAAELGPLARRSGAKIVEVNIASSGMSAHADLFLKGRAGEILPQIL